MRQSQQGQTGNKPEKDVIINNVWSGKKEIRDKTQISVFSDQVKVNANYQNKSLSVVKDNEFTHPTGDVQQAFEYGVQDSREIRFREKDVRGTDADR